MRFQELKSTFLDLHYRISMLPSLEPSPMVNTLFSTLVQICTRPSSQAVQQIAQDMDIQALRSSLIRFCSQAEGFLERHHGQRILAAADTAVELFNFPYYDNYRDLVRLEYQLLRGIIDPGVAIRRVTFVGSGPLPLTVLVLAQDYLPAARFHAVDVDVSANDIARCVVTRLGDQLARRIDFISTEIEKVTDVLAECEVVFLAALVGVEREEKRQVIAHLAAHMRPGAILVVRSAHGLRSMLYPVVQEADLIGFNVLVTAHPGNHIVNSVIVAQKIDN